MTTWYTISRANDMQGIIAEEETGRMVAVSYDVKDAPLLAAAPDMLEALRLWDEGFSDGEEFTAAQFVEWVNGNRRAARAAIQKATEELTVRK